MDGRTRRARPACSSQRCPTAIACDADACTAPPPTHTHTHTNTLSLPSTPSQPSMFMLEYMQKKFGIAADEICMVGDRLDTDIEFGNNGGARTMLVLSGVTTEETLLSPENAIKPDFYAPNLPELAKSTSVTA